MTNLLNAYGQAVAIAAVVGLLYASFTLSIGISFRILNYPDLGLDGAAMLGGAAFAFAARSGWPVLACIAASILGGALAGLLTAGQHIVLGVNKLLTGIVTSAILYSVSIRLMGGRSNVRLPDSVSMFFQVNPGRALLLDLVVLLVPVSIIVFGLLWLFRTRLGFLLRILGDNASFSAALGENPRVLTAIGLVIANSLTGFGGALLVQYKGASDVNTVIGLLVSALACLAVGEAVFQPTTIGRFLFAAVGGTVIYNLAIAAVLFSWTSRWEAVILPSDVRLATGALLLAAIWFAKKGSSDRKLFRSEW